MIAPSRCRACLCVCTDEEHALTIEQADALKLDAMTALVCFDCWRKSTRGVASTPWQIGTVADDDRYPVAVQP